MTPLIENRKARKDYTIVDTLEAGIVLTGQEVKSLRAKRGVISDSFVKILGNEAFLINARIEQHQTTAHLNYDPTMSRKLLLHRRQIRMLEEVTQTKGHSAIPLLIGVKSNFIKVLIGIGKGKKSVDRKEELKQRDLRREQDSLLKRLR